MEIFVCPKCRKIKRGYDTISTQYCTCPPDENAPDEAALEKWARDHSFEIERLDGELIDTEWNKFELSNLRADLKQAREDLAKAMETIRAMNWVAETQHFDPGYWSAQVGLAVATKPWEPARR